MKKQLLIHLGFISLVGFLPNRAMSQTKRPVRAMAIAGDTVWVVINQVKADKRAQYERFLHQIFWPGASKLSQQEQKVFRRTRILHPVAPETDGTYSYFFLMDPLIPRGNYDIENLLTKMYDEAKAKEHMKLFNDAVVGDSKVYKVVQSPD